MRTGDHLVCSEQTILGHTCGTHCLLMWILLSTDVIIISVTCVCWCYNHVSHIFCWQCQSYCRLMLQSFQSYYFLILQSWYIVYQCYNHTSHIVCWRYDHVILYADVTIMSVILFADAAIMADILFAHFTTISVILYADATIISVILSADDGSYCMLMLQSWHINYLLILPPRQTYWMLIIRETMFKSETLHTRSCYCCCVC